MRILHVISTLSPAAGGPPTAVLGMARTVAALGHDVSIHCTDHGMSPEAVRAAAHEAGDAVRIVVHRHVMPGALTRHASMGLWTALAKEIPKSDVVHLHSLYMFQDWVVHRECLRTSVPYILQPHGTLDPFLYYHHRLRKFVAEMLFQDKVTRNATLLHFTTDDERLLALPFSGLMPNAVVPLGVEIDRFKNLPSPDVFRRRFPEIRQRRIILFLGRLNFKKGLEFLIPAVGAAARRHDDLHLVIAGPDGGFAKRAQTLVREQRLGGRTTFTGHLDAEGVREALAAAYMFVLPSHTENFGIAAAEAMAAGLPCLLSAHVQLADQAAKHDACRIVALDVDVIAKAIEELLSSRETAEAIGRAARKYAEATFRWKEVGIQLIDMYKMAISLSEKSKTFARRDATRRAVPLSSGEADGSIASSMPISVSASPSRLRILHAISTLSPAAGGPPVGVLAMARALAALGHDVSIHCTDHGMSEEAVRAVMLESTDSMHIVVHRHVTPGAVTRHASIGLWRALAHEIPRSDVVHLHSLYMFQDWVVRRECRRAGIPYIMQPHGALDPFLHAHHRWRKTIAETIFQNNVTRDATLIQFTSRVEEDLARPFTFDRRGIVVPVGVELERYENLPAKHHFRTHYPEIRNRRIVLFLGRLNFKKGLEILVPAFAAVLSRHEDVHLVIAGPDGGFAATTRELGEKWGISGNMTLTGYLSNERALEALAAADIFVLPSHTENFGMAAAEALAAGVPSVLSREVQIAPAAAQEGACLAIPVEISAWTEAIIQLLSDPRAAREMGDRAKKYAIKTYSWPSIALEFVKAYRLAIELYNGQS